MFLKQSTASQSVIIGPFVDKTDGNTQETGLTIANTDIRLSKNGGNLAAKTSGGGTHDEEGWYTITLDATDTNTVGMLQLFCHIEASALPVYHEFDVIEEAVYVDMFASSAAGYAGITEMAAAQTDLDTLTAGVTLAAGAVTDASLAGGLEIVFETDFGTNYNTTRNAWVTNGTDFIGTGWNVAKTGYALTTADWNVGKTGYSLTATTGLGAQTANITGNLSGSVGSVTGAVGSVTGSVGSVTGAVGSVTGAVGSVTGHTNQTGDTYAIANGAAGFVAIDTVVDDIKVVTDALGSAGAANLALSAAGIIGGVAEAGTLSTTVMTSDLTGYVNDELIGRTIIWTGGDADGQATDVTDYASAAGTVTYTAITTLPAAGDTFVIV